MRLVKYCVLFIIWYPFRWIVRLLTTHRGKYQGLLTIGSWLGNLAYICFPLGRKIIKEELENLGVYQPVYVKKTFQHMMKIEMEGMVFEDLNRRLIEQITVFKGLEHLDNAEKEGKGAILLLFHFGWNMHTIPALGYMGYPIHQIADAGPVDLQRKLSFCQRKVIEKRLSNADDLPVTFLKAGSYMGPVVRVLKENKVLILALDGREAKNFSAYPFMDRHIMLSPVILKLGRKTGTPVIPMITYRGEDGRHRVILHEPLKETTPDAMVLETLPVFEQYFRERPWQYAHYLLSNRLLDMRLQDGKTSLIVP